MESSHPQLHVQQYNPYKERLHGDWFIYAPGIYRHPGEVYLNGVSFYEANSLDEVKNPTVHTSVHNLHGLKPMSRSSIRS